MLLRYHLSDVDERLDIEQYRVNMTMPTSRPDDDNETLYWLQMAKRVLAGEIEPHEARNALEGRSTVTKLKRRPQTRH